VDPSNAQNNARDSYGPESIDGNEFFNLDRFVWTVGRYGTLALYSYLCVERVLNYGVFESEVSRLFDASVVASAYYLS